MDVAGRFVIRLGIVMPLIFPQLSRPNQAMHQAKTVFSVDVSTMNVINETDVFPSCPLCLKMVSQDPGKGSRDG
jgi:hypothetical protein